MKKTLLIVVTILSVLLASACNLPKGEGTIVAPSEAIASIIAPTLTSITQGGPQTPSVTLTMAAPTDTQTPAATFTPTLTITNTYVPSKTPTITNTPAPTQTPIPKPGSIAGGISGYPYGAVPSLTIVAFGQEKPYNYSYLITAPGDTSYSMSSSYLLPGKFQVVAYDSSGHKGGCTTLVTVKSDETSNCDITDWGGSYPSKPSGVPYTKIGQFIFRYP